MTEAGGKGFEFLKDPSPVPRRCAFCRQELETAVPVRCRRCAAGYHSDCWDANGKRCAVYACEPVETPVPAEEAPRPQPYRLPQERSTGSGRGWLIFVALGISSLTRICATTNSHPHRTRTPVKSPAPQYERYSRQTERSSPIYEPAEPRNTPFFVRGCALYDLQQWNECLAEFEEAASRLPSLRDAAHIRMFFARSRLGESERAARLLREYLKSPRWENLDSWGEKSLLFVAGEIPENEYLKQIPPSANGTPQPERACEAYFYAGTLRLLAGDEVRARVYLGLCMGTHVIRSSEYGSARAEIQALDSKR